MSYSLLAEPSKGGLNVFRRLSENGGEALFRIFPINSTTTMVENAKNSVLLTTQKVGEKGVDTLSLSWPNFGIKDDGRTLSVDSFEDMWDYLDNLVNPTQNESAAAIQTSELPPVSGNTLANFIGDSIWVRSENNMYEAKYIGDKTIWSKTEKPIESEYLKNVRYFETDKGTFSFGWVVNGEPIVEELESPHDILNTEKIKLVRPGKTPTEDTAFILEGDLYIGSLLPVELHTPLFLMTETGDYSSVLPYNESESTEEKFLPLRVYNRLSEVEPTGDNSLVLVLDASESPIIRKWAAVYAVYADGGLDLLRWYPTINISVGTTFSKPGSDLENSELITE